MIFSVIIEAIWETNISEIKIKRDGMLISQFVCPYGKRKWCCLFEQSCLSGLKLLQDP